MKVYIRKLDNQCIKKQISFTKEVLNDFLGSPKNHDTILCEGLKSKEQESVKLLFATDPRFDSSIKKLLNQEGNFSVGDLMVMYKDTNKYYVELIDSLDSRYNTYIKLFSNDRHVLLECDKGLEDKNIFDGFSSWLVSYNNPDYTGKEVYSNYTTSLVRLVDFMFKRKLIEDKDLNELNVEKYKKYILAYDSSNEAKNYDKKNLSSKAGIAALKKYLKYIEFVSAAHSECFDYLTTKNNSINKIFFGVPGCGKSYHIQHKELSSYDQNNVIRTTFYQDYSNTDFVGQILPRITKDEEGHEIVEYIFNPGPFTLALIQAISHPDDKVALVIEEINRGNAPAIFGDIFQLLDRDENSISEYGIINVGVLDYINNFEFIVKGRKTRYHFNEIKIPGNLSIFATMNTSDQNVYTLDTAFTRRWDKERIPNDFNGHRIKNMLVPKIANCSWGKFVDIINNHIRDNLESLQVNEDKQIGAFFIKERDLLDCSTSYLDNEIIKKAYSFAYKVLEYLWSDVSKLDHGIMFNPLYKSFADLLKAFIQNGIEVFNDKLRMELETKEEKEDKE